MSSDQLERRLRTGEALIETETDPNEQQRLTDFWIDLLHRYERQVDAERRQPEGRASA